MAARDAGGGDARGGPQGALRYHREDPRLLPRQVDGRPVVVGGHEGSAVGRLEDVAVDVAYLRADLAEDRPGDLAVGHEPVDGDGHVITAERVVVQRLSFHVTDETAPRAGAR